MDDVENTNTGGGNTWIWVVVFVVVLGGLVFLLGNDGTELATENEPEETIITEDAITVSAQNTGTEVLVESVAFLAPGYVTVHRAVDGAPGDVIGHSELLPAGESINVSVTLDEEIVEGEQVFAMLHTDDGDGSYNFPGEDGPTIDGDGNIVMTLVDVVAKAEMVEEVSGPEENRGEDTETNGDDVTTDTKEVNYTKSGFSPKIVTIVEGGTVKWTNNSDRDMWVASDVHPTHTLYPVESESDCLGSSFDACTGVKPGSSWEFTFDEVGEWDYHDHKLARNKGKVVVE